MQYLNKYLPFCQSRLRRARHSRHSFSSMYINASSNILRQIRLSLLLVRLRARSHVRKGSFAYSCGCLGYTNFHYPLMSDWPDVSENFSKEPPPPHQHPHQKIINKAKHTRPVLGYEPHQRENTPFMQGNLIFELDLEIVNIYVAFVNLMKIGSLRQLYA